jgi:glycosyltransferase involved in cell wall biosynthesis
VSIIAGAEARRIGHTLATVADWADEIIIVLNEEVADGTDTVAAKFGAKVFREPWKGYVAQKNSAAAKATQPWILGLDADEIVSGELRAEIEHLFNTPVELERHAAYDFPRCTFYLGRWIRHGDWYPDRQTRLWQRGRAQWEGVDPHAKLVVNGEVGRLRAELLHFSMENLNRQLQKIGVYGDYYARQRIADGRSPDFADFAVRPLWRFVRCYFLRLGFLDGWVGFFLAWQTAFACLTRYAKVREARLPAPPSVSSSCQTSPSSSSPATPAR